MAVPSNKLPVVGPLGAVEEVPRDSVADYLSKGYRPLSDNEYDSWWNKKEYGEGIGNEVGAFAGGVARGLTFGVSDLVGPRFGVVSKETLAGQRNENPVASGAGEITGVVIPAVLTGGASAEAEGAAAGLGAAAEGAAGAAAEGLGAEGVGVTAKAAAKAAEALEHGARTVGAGVRGASALGAFAEHGVGGLLTGLGHDGLQGLAKELIPEIASGAAEGSLYGMGHEITESSLGDEELTAEKLLAGAGVGALLGGATKGLFGLGGAGFSAAKRSLEGQLEGTLGEKAEDFVKDFVESSRLRAVFGLSKKAMKKFGAESEQEWLPAEAQKVAGAILADKPLQSIEQINAKLGQYLDRVGQQKGAVMDVLDQATAGARPVTADEVAKRVEGLARRLDPETHADAIGVLRGYAEKLRTAGSEDSEAAQALRARADQVRAHIADLDPQITEGTTLKGKPYSSSQVPGAVERRDALRAELADLERQATEAKGFSFAEAAAKRLKTQEKGKFDMAVPTPVRQAWRNISRVWNDVIDEKAAPVLEKAGIAPDAYQALRRQEGVLIGMKDYSDDRIAGNLANRHVSLTDNMAGMATFAGAIASGHPLTALPAAALSAIANKAARVYAPAALAHYSDKMATLLAVARRSAKASTELEHHLVTFVEAARNAAPAGAEHATEHQLHHGVEQLKRASVPAALQTIDALTPPPVKDERGKDKKPPRGGHSDASDALKAKGEALAALVNNPQKMLEVMQDVSGPLSQHAPKVAVHVAAKVAKIAQALAGAAAKSPHAQNPLVPLPWKPSAADASHFAALSRVAHKGPMVAVQDMAAGRLQARTVAALRTLWPASYNAMAGRIIGLLSEKPSALSYRDRAQLSVFLGQPLDPSVTPRAIAQAQAVWAQPQPAQGRGGGGARVAGVDKITAPDALKTRSQVLSGVA